MDPRCGPALTPGACKPTGGGAPHLQGDSLMTMTATSTGAPEPWAGAPREPRKWQRDALPAITAAVRARKRGIVSAVMGAGKTDLTGEVAYLASARPGAKVVVIGVPTQALVRQTAASIEGRVGAGRVGQWFADKKQLRPVVVACYDSLPGLAVELVARGLACGVLVCDEVHQTQAETVRGAVRALAPSWCVGFTATPFRSNGKERLEDWDEIVYSYSLGDALRDGVLVPWRTVNYDGAGEDGTDHVVCEMIRRDAEGPGIVSARTIEDAEQYAAYLRDHGLKAEAIHSAMPRAARDLRIEWLRDGTGTRCLVHVNLLSEGVDLPWLRWLGMRRPVDARVRFVQELGRVLRSHPGKTEAVLLDPHDLLGLHGIAHAPTLGVGGACAETLDPRSDEERDERVVLPSVLPPAVAIDAATRWARALLLSLQAHGLAESKVGSRSWRTRAPTEKQIKALAYAHRLASRKIPDEHRKATLRLSRPEVARGLQCGAVSDLISVLFAVADAGSWPEGLTVPVLDPAYVKNLPEVSHEPVRWAPMGPTGVGS